MAMRWQTVVLCLTAALIAGITGAAWRAARVMAEDESMMTNETSDTSLELRLEVADEYVQGLPMLVALTLDVRTPGETIRMLPEPTLLSLKDCIAVMVTPAGSHDALLDYNPTPVLDLEHRPPRLALSAGEPRRWLVDLSELDWSAVTEPGDYTIAVRYQARHAGSAFARARVRLRAPAQDELAWLGAQRPVLEETGSWGEWVLEPPDAAQDIPPESVPLPARLHAYLRALIHDPRPLAEIGTPGVEQVLPLARPEAGTIALELALAHGDEAEARRLANELRTTVPGLAWRLEAIAEGGGLVRNNRLAD
jgi:hypothetical protein